MRERERQWVRERVREDKDVLVRETSYEKTWSVQHKYAITADFLSVLQTYEILPLNIYK